MGIAKILDDLDNFIKYNGLFDPLFSLLNKDFEKNIKPYREAKRRGDIDLLISTMKKLMDYYDNELLGKKVQPLDMLDRFQAIANDNDIQYIVSHYSEHMERNLLHAERFELIINYSLRHLPEDHILPMSKVLSGLTVTKLTSSLNLSYLTNTKDRIASGLMQLAQRCPKKHRLEVFKYLSPDPFVTACLKEGGCFSQVQFFKFLLADKSDEEALRDLRFSRTWLSLEKTPNLYEHLQEYEPRFLPALDYEN